ncbi:MAG: hypothetical protein ABI378_05955 [Chitinophagaceae bacterium]
MTIGIIGEGVSDFYTLRSILQSFTEDKALPLNQLQPKSKMEPGNWDKVFKYCATDEFRQAFAFNDYIVIQVDTDFLRSDSIPQEYIVPKMESLTPSEINVAMRTLLINAIGKDFYQEHSAAIIFAIAVDQIECWFLAIYFPNSPAKSKKHKNCIETLNPELQTKHGFTIVRKQEVYYLEICKAFKKKGDLINLSKSNDSFLTFIKELEEKLLIVQQ